MSNYLYGKDRIELPEVPVVDGFPCVVIYKPANVSGQYKMTMLESQDVMLNWDGDDATGQKWYTLTKGIKVWYSYTLYEGDESWRMLPSYTTNATGNGFGGGSGGAVPIWNNFGLYGKDGNLYLAASEPIPIGTAQTLDPTALLMGWQVGNRIRGGA